MVELELTTTHGEDMRDLVENSPDHQYGTLWNIAAVVAFLIGPGANFITGTTYWWMLDRQRYRSSTANITAEQFHRLLSTYATTQHKNGTPYVAESHYPERDAWS
jgi:hypothetical protein